jgi:hypothetical protein
MKNVWLRIGLGAAVIFLIGMVVVRVFKAGRDRVVSMVEGDADIPIPLMGVIPFQVGNTRLGDLRRMTLLRDAPHHISGVQLVARLGDSATVDPLKDCGFLTIEGYEHRRAGEDMKINVNGDTRFKCLADSVGYASFGTIEVEHVQGKDETTLRRTLILPPEVIAEIQAAMGRRDSVDGAALEDSIRIAVDSIEQAVQVQVRQAEAQARGASARAARGAATTSSAPAAPAAPAPAPVPATPKP